MAGAQETLSNDPDTTETGTVMLSVGPTSQGMQRVRRSGDRPSTAPGPGGWVEDEDSTGSCACPEEVPETESREGVWPLGCSCTKGPECARGLMWTHRYTGPETSLRSQPQLQQWVHRFT